MIRVIIIFLLSVDTTPPLIIERVGNIEQIIERGVPGIEIIWQEPSSTDVSNTDVLLSRSIAPGFFFTADATTVIYTFTDETGNTATDSFCVTLIVGERLPFKSVLLSGWFLNCDLCCSQNVVCSMNNIKRIFSVPAFCFVVIMK